MVNSLLQRPPQWPLLNQLSMSHNFLLDTGGIEGRMGRGFWPCQGQIK